jgi:16S rRNA (cytosine967-C5)-methyltransferase
LYHKKQLDTAKWLLSAYDGKEPFHLYLKKYFSKNKKHGSKDRKNITSMCYSFFRMGKAIVDMSIEDRILTGTFLTNSQGSELLEQMKPEWNHIIQEPLRSKLSAIDHNLLLNEIFPYKDELSEGLEQQKISESILTQPRMYVRIRPGGKESVIKKLIEAQVNYELVDDNCLSFENGTKIETILEPDKEIVVQDYNSQKAGALLERPLIAWKRANADVSTSVWDCCAGSGGKSIMAYDIDPTINLIVSDTRDSILANLVKRFNSAGIKKYNCFTADLTKQQGLKLPASLDVIIADVPCTGSGTWGRSPEQLYYFDKQKIEEYSARQKKIVSSVIPHLRKGGTLLYITCSVFKKENEEVVEYLCDKHQLQVIEKQIFKGYEMKADTLFVALLVK